MKLRELIVILFGFLLITSCESADKVDGENEISARGKFEPADGKCLLFVGQDMGAIGGLDDYNDGYADHFETPAGITIYTNFHTKTSDGNAGIFSKANWGAGDCYADLQVKDETFANSVLAIGLEIVGAEQDIVNGKADHLIEELGSWMGDLSPRPIFLRIGYEFDGHAWNHYSLTYYTKAWRYIVDYLDAMKVENVAYVWQSMGSATKADAMEEWYPGDRYVDWCAYSYFYQPDQEMITFARKHQKPVFIAEATPVRMSGGSYLDCDLTNPVIARLVWDEWFVGLFETIEQNDDVVKALSYINVEWLAQEMWIDNATFQKVDSRIQESEYITERWVQKISDERYLKPSLDLFEQLNALE